MVSAPQHLVDMLDSSSSGSFSDTLTAWSNLVLAGGIPLPVRQIFLVLLYLQLTKRRGKLDP